MPSKHHTPYTYLIGWSCINKFYYGARWARDCHPDDLWSKYKTSSSVVKRVYKKYGDPDIIQIRKTFNSKKEAMLWEQKVLVRLHKKLPFHHKQSVWLNINPYASPPGSTGKKSKGNLGRKFTEEHKRKISESNKGKSFSLESRQKMSNSQKNKAPISSQTREKLSTAGKNKFLNGYKQWNKGLQNCFTDEWKSERSKKYSGKGNPRYGQTLSEETKIKIGEKGKGTYWYNDGVRNYRVKPEIALANNYCSGRIKKAANH